MIIIFKVYTDFICLLCENISQIVIARCNMVYTIGDEKVESTIPRIYVLITCIVFLQLR